MNILGISGGVMHGNQDAAAVLLMDGELVFAQEEERFLREKHAVGALPELAVRAALSHANLTMLDIDRLAFHADYRNLEDRLRRYFTHQFGCCPPIRFVNHHFAHAASTYYASGFRDAMILTTDLSGDGLSTTLSFGEGDRITVLKQYAKPQSLGIFYSLVTQVLGFRRDSDEYKVMGMASYGQPTQDLSYLLKVHKDGYALNEEYMVKFEKNAPNLSKQEPLYSDQLVKKVGWRRLSGESYTETHFDFAASAQHTLNQAAIALIRGLHAQTGSKNLCVAGGVGLNCAMNQQLMSLPEVEQIFVQPASSDAGTALGAAYVVALEEGDRLTPFPGAHLGNEFTSDQIRKELDTLGVNYREVTDVSAAAADAIANEQIIGWFQGRHEYGPRALGARSILADPRISKMKDRINERVKFREEFRPFAPSVLAAHADTYFDTIGNDLPYMTVTTDARNDADRELGAVVHVDGTSRIQTVDAERAPIYHRLLEHMYEKTGCPVVLNTSFNVKGQPVVNTPTHAVGTFYGSGLDKLFIGPFIIEKNSRPDEGNLLRS